MRDQSRAFLWRALIVILMISGSLLQARPQSCSSSTIEAIKKRGALVVGMLKQDFPPYIMTSKAGIKGIEVELAQYFAGALGVQLKIIRTAITTDEIIDQVASGMVDMGISSISITIPRASKVNFSIPYMHLQKGIILNRLKFNRLRQDEAETLRQFYSRGDKRGVDKGSSYVVFAKNLFPKTQVVQYDTWAKAIHDLDQGKIEGAMNDNFEVLKTMWSSSQGLFKYIPIILKEGSDPIAIALPSTDPHFLNWVNTLLTVDKIHYNLEKIRTTYENYLKEEDPR